MGYWDQCSVKGCTLRVKSRGLCKAHYTRWQRGSVMNAPLVRTLDGVPNTQLPCGVKGCGRPRDVGERCTLHHLRQKRGDAAIGAMAYTVRGARPGRRERWGLRLFESAIEEVEYEAEQMEVTPVRLLSCFLEDWAEDYGRRAKEARRQFQAFFRLSDDAAGALTHAEDQLRLSRTVLIAEMVEDWSRRVLQDAEAKLQLPKEGEIAHLRYPHQVPQGPAHITLVDLLPPLGLSAQTLEARQLMARRIELGCTWRERLARKVAWQCERHGVSPERLGKPGPRVEAEEPGEAAPARVHPPHGLLGWMGGSQPEGPPGGEGLEPATVAARPADGEVGSGTVTHMRSRGDG